VLSILRKIIIVLIPVVVAFLVAISKGYEDLGLSAQNMPAPSMENLLTQEEIDQYKEDGFVLKKKLVVGDELAKLQRASEEVAGSFFWTDLVFGAKYYKKLAMQAWKFKRHIAQFALGSNLGSIAAQLLQEETSIRILKDAVFAAVSTSKGCGFHVDDKGFWPANGGGATFWIALSPMRISEGGGIRLAKGSHTANWALECREVIKNGTCNIEELSPSCYERLLAVSVTHDMDPGDAIIWDRYLFHRGDPFLEESNEQKLRYSIRYVPSGVTARGMHHSSVKTGELLKGPHYPQVWPRALEEEVEGFASFGSSIKARLLPFF